MEKFTHSIIQQIFLEYLYHISVLDTGDIAQNKRLATSHPSRENIINKKKISKRYFILDGSKCYGEKLSREENWKLRLETKMTLKWT